MPKSVIDAIRSGIWDFEPQAESKEQFAPTRALPGSDEKLAILSERLLSGQPLWHPSDRLHHDETNTDS